MPRAERQHASDKAKGGINGGMARTAVANGLVANAVLLPRERKGRKGSGL